jgi:hypothetical protein
VTVSRAIRRHANTLGAVSARRIDGPALLHGTYGYFFPEFFILSFVFNMKIIDIKSTDIRLDFVNAVITPVICLIPDYMTMRANKTSVITSGV